LQDMKSPSAVDNLSSNKFFMNYVLSFMAHAEDKPIIAYVQLFTRIVTRLAAKNPELCYKVLYPSRSADAFDPKSAIGLDEARQVTYAILRAATSGAQHDLPAPSAEDAVAPLTQIWEQLRRDHPEDINALSAAGSSRLSHDAVCQAHARMYTQLGKLPT
jgi:hypothetical protein